MVSWVERAGFEAEEPGGVWGFGEFCGERGGKGGIGWVWRTEGLVRAVMMESYL